MKWIYELSQKELLKELQQKEFKSYAADQIFLWLYNKGEPDINRWENISKKNRDIFKENYFTDYNKVIDISNDKEGTVKFLIQLHDKKKIEAVLIKEKQHFTFCISTQVGCPLECTFCATGRIGFKRNLTSGEIINQVLILKNFLDPFKGKVNIVFMGMGEPLLNYKNLNKALQIIISPEALSISPRSVTVSTAGIFKGIKDLLKDFPQIKLGFSLNASNQKLREELMPQTKNQNLEIILTYFRDTSLKHKITFEYVLLKGINHSLDQARELVNLIKGIKCKINLIPFNKNSSGFSPPEERDIEIFARYLKTKNLTITTRWSKGNKIKAACGQLALSQT